MSDVIERSHLAELEAVIERGQQTFIDVGNALMEIRDQRLYRATHATFEAYCKERWGWSRISAYRHIEAAEAVALLPIGNKPSSESVARELVPLSPAERIAVAEHIDLSTATAAEVLRAARDIKSEQRQERLQDRVDQRAAVLKTSPPLNGERYRVFVHDVRDGPPSIAAPAAIITDPPYLAEYLDTYDYLDMAAEHLLPDGGSLLAMCGQSHLD